MTCFFKINHVSFPSKVAHTVWFILHLSRESFLRVGVNGTITEKEEYRISGRYCSAEYKSTARSGRGKRDGKSKSADAARRERELIFHVGLGFFGYAV